MLGVFALLFVSLLRPTTESLLCGSTEEIKLPARGRASAMSLILSGGDRNDASEPCTLNVYAPHVYALSLQLIDAENPFLHIEKANQKKNQRKKNKAVNTENNTTVPDCDLNVFYIDQDDSVPLLRITPCSPDFSIKKFAPQLISAPIKIEWWPPIWPHHTDHLRLIVTAINTGKTCHQDDQVTCIRAGLEPPLCVSMALACDDVKHCPTGNGGDEEPSLCALHQSNWVQEFLKRFASKHEEILGINMITSRPNNEVTTKSTTETTKSAGRSRKGLSALDAALEPYGTWGYMMLGMLICATVLIIFGVWECFCHYSRTQDQSMPPDCVAPAAICSSHPQHWRPYPPPNYDEVEPPPPSYSVLFPGTDKSIDIPSTSQEENTQSA